MGGGGYTAQPADLQSTAPQYDAVSQQVQQIYNTLTQGLEAEGACWGNDDQGHAFGTKYCQPALTLLQQMGNTNEGLQSMVDGICSWARNFVDVEQAATASAQQLSADAGN